MQYFCTGNIIYMYNVTEIYINHISNKQKK